MKVYLGIGTNLGNRTANIQQAIDKISKQAGTLLACSSFMETAPWGFHSQHMFLNIVVAIDTLYTPHELLHITQSIEKDMGRTHKTVNSNYTDRVIDIDILLYGEESIQTPDLIIPHPLIMQRDFVYRPLFEIAPETEQLLNLKQLNS